MASDIFLSEEYGWTAFGIFKWMIEFLLGSVTDKTTREHLRTVVAANLGVGHA